MRHTRERDIDVSGARLHLYEWAPLQPATSPQVTLVLHGGPGLWFYLDDLTPLLPQHHAVVGYDQRGCGLSTGPGPYSMQQQITDLEAVRKAAGNGSVHLIGHSAGANLGLAYAMQYPDHVTSVTYLSGTGIGDWRPAYRSERKRRLGPERAQRLSELAHLPERTAEQEYEFRLLSWCTDYTDVESGMSLAAVDAQAPFAINFEANKSIGDPDFMQLTSVKVPIAVVHGEADIRPFSSSQLLAEALPHATFTLIPNAGHNPWRENPEAVRAALGTVAHT